MPLLNSLTNALNKATDRLEDAVHKQATRPRVPRDSKPQNYQQPLVDGHNSQPLQRKAYWHPSFTPSTPVNEHFRHEIGAHGWGNNEAQTYCPDPRNSFFSPSPASNAIHVVAIADQKSLSDKFTSARLTSHQTLSRRRGAISARITAPIAKGVWPAFWLLPADPFKWPDDGEVDIFEAWDGSTQNHSCLHWGHFNGEDWNKHRVTETELGHRITAGAAGPGHADQDGVLFEFAWDEAEDGKDGRLIWYVDGKPVMKAHKPQGTRSLKDYRILINVAMGGNVCKGRLPDDGRYEMVVRDLAMWEEPACGWSKFDKDFKDAKEGHP
ncbi:hypothetical protein KVT40_003409 [Elsinoe batatas]|uniref:GH16 domain-containing protein n=1 Tax=Elsinoe batatas TaxID=2601811 RepID=A0A8K0L6T6_9PEZI|nr:hypothetical protein KVT40_003409 [Elsinoe batatas]